MSLQVYLQTPEDRARAVDLVRRATKGLVVEIREPKKTSRQTRYMHALLDRIAKARIVFAGREWTAKEWKGIAISGLDTIQRGEVDPNNPPMITGLEGELCQIRRSAADFSRKEAAEFIEYLIAFCAQRDIDTEEPT